MCKLKTTVYRLRPCKRSGVDFQDMFADVEGGDVANVLNERAYNEEVKKAKAWEAKNE